VSLDEAIKNGNGKTAHQECVDAFIEAHPKPITTGPIDLICPLCSAKAGEDCKVLLHKGVEVVHVQRIKTAATYIVNREHPKRTKILID
jgi:hypothetical protein